MTDLTPKEIVAELDRYVVGQNEAKRSVALALRNRWRHQRLEEKIRDEIYPKNILMIGPTGVGKTEISRRIAKLSDAPFIKVEATKFTEIGYVGRDVEQIIRDLVQVAVDQATEKRKQQVLAQATNIAEEKIAAILIRKHNSPQDHDTTREYITRIRKNMYDEETIDISLEKQERMKFPMFDMPDIPGAQIGMMNLGDMLGKMMGGKQRKVYQLKVTEAVKLLINEESEKLIDINNITQQALSDVENRGIVFIDEIDKITSSHKRGQGPEVSREGVQRDLLPLIEGCTVTTKHGSVHTRHILFIASGAFHVSTPADLLPELQGRLPIRVQLKPLTRDDFKCILIDTEVSLIKQCVALFATEGVKLKFTEDAIDKIAEYAESINNFVEDIGARRLHTVLEKVQEEVSFDAPSLKGSNFTIDADYVKSRALELVQNEDLSKFVL